MHQLAAGFVAAATITAAVSSPPPTIEQCFADHGFDDVTVYSDGSVDVPVFTMADNNAGQAWDAHTTTIYDTCTP